MPGSVYTVASGKGGVGKTTTTVNLGVALWQEGNAVAVVDADLGMANLSAVLGLEPETTLHDVLAGEAILEEAIVEAKGGDLLVLPGSRELEGFAAANPQKLKDVLENLAARCDYVIVDTGAGLGYEDVLPLGLADAVILVSSADPASLGDTRKTAELADLVETPVLGVIVTRAVEGTDSEAIAAEIGAPLLGTIPEDPAVMEATVAGDPLASHAPNADATAAYMGLGATIEDVEVPTIAEPADEEREPEPAATEPSETQDAEADEAAIDAEGGSGDEGVPEAEDATPEDEEATEVDEPAEADDDEPDASTDEAPDSLTADEGEAAEPSEADAEDGSRPEDTEEAAPTSDPDSDADDDVDEPTGAAEDADDSGDADDETADETSVTAEPEPEEQDTTVEDAEAEEDDVAEDQPEERSGGLRGWLGRLFS